MAVVIEEGEHALVVGAQKVDDGAELGLLKALGLDEALEVANGVDYALTGGFFSRSPANIERVKAELVAGNVYINRSCTGAVVGRHPFGGFKMSGGGTKAGGRDYLLQFLIPRIVTENIMRHGFAPEETPRFRDEFLVRRGGSTTVQKQS